MHLDCCFSILGDDVCLMLEDMMGAESPTRRLVDEYVRAGAGSPYVLARSDVEFAAFMRGEGYAIIPVSGADQLVRGRGEVGGEGRRARRARERWATTPAVSFLLSRSALRLQRAQPGQLQDCVGARGHGARHRAAPRVQRQDEAGRAAERRGRGARRADPPPPPPPSGDVQVIDFGSITSMYGAVHCASQVVKRTPRRW